MIENSFIFLPGISLQKEKSIWKQGITNWNEFLNARKIKGIGNPAKLYYDKLLLQAKKALLEEDVSFFAKFLPRKEHWRLYNYFKEDVVFLDIETFGYNHITIIGLYNNYEVQHLVTGANLCRELLKEELSKYKLLVSFNGLSFDVPVINNYFNKIVPDIPHVDLRHLCARLRLNGGLKLIEKTLGIKRNSVLQEIYQEGVLTVWQKFKSTENEDYLQQILEYNAEDVINLRPLANYCFEKMQSHILKSFAKVS